MIRALAPAMLMLLAGCTAKPPPAEPGLAALGQSVTIGPVTITPRTLIEDSRCPQAVSCVWQGRVRLQALIDDAQQELTLGQPLPVAGGALMLAEVRPARRPEAEIASRDYRFRFSFTP